MVQGLAKEGKGEMNQRSHLLAEVSKIPDRIAIHSYHLGLRRAFSPFSDHFLSLSITRQVVDAVRSTGRNLPCEDVKGGVMVHSMTMSAPRQPCSMRRGKRVCASLHRCTNYLFVLQIHALPVYFDAFNPVCFIA